MSRPSRVLAVGWFGEGNLGDEAMLEGLLRWLARALGDVDATVVTADPRGTAARYGVRSIRRASPDASGFGSRELLRASLRSDLVTLGGGDLIREQADGTAPALNWLRRVRVPLRLRRPTVLVGVSVGELVTRRVLDAVAQEVKRFDLVAARDRESAEQLAELSGRPVEVMGDLALEALEPLGGRASDAAARDSRRPARIGVATRTIIGRGPSVAPDATQRLEAELAAGLDRVVHETGAAIELLPLLGPGPRRRRDDDVRAGELLAARARSGSAWVRHAALDDAAAFGQLAVGLDLVLSVRLHGTVLGAAAGRRVVGLAYDPKVSGFLTEIGLAGQALPLDAPAADIADTVLRSLADETLEDRVRAGVTTARQQTRALEPRLRSIAGLPDHDPARRLERG